MADLKLNDRQTGCLRYLFGRGGSDRIVAPGALAPMYRAEYEGAANVVGVEARVTQGQLNGWTAASASYLSSLHRMGALRIVHPPNIGYAYKLTEVARRVL